MTAQRIVTQRIAHQSVKAFEAFPHVDGLKGDVDFGGRPQPGTLRAFGNADQPSQLFLNETRRNSRSRARCSSRSREALLRCFHSRHIYLHQSRLRPQLPPTPVIEGRQRQATLRAELPPGQVAFRELSHHLPHLRRTSRLLPHAPILPTPLRRLLKMGSSDAYVISVLQTWLGRSIGTPRSRYG